MFHEPTNPDTATVTFKTATGWTIKKVHSQECLEAVVKDIPRYRKAVLATWYRERES